MESHAWQTAAMLEPLLRRLGLCAALILVPGARGQEAPAAERPPAPETGERAERGWEGLVQLHLFVPIRSPGEVTAREVQVELEGQKHGFPGLGARLELRSPWRLGGVLDAYLTRNRAELKDRTVSVEVGGGQVALRPRTAQVDRFSLDALAAFEVGRLELGQGVELRLFAEAGVAWVHYRTQLDLELDGTDVSLVGTDDAVELVLGADLELSLLGGLLGFVAQGDVGGFGLGDASQLTWKAVFAVRVRPIPPLSFDLGYRGVSVEYEGPGGRVEVEVVNHGLFLAANFHF